MSKPKDDDNLGSFYMGRMRPPPEPKRVLPKGALTVATLVAFVAILWYAYPQGQEKYSGVDVPVITADKNVYKFKPEDPGGMQVRHQDSTVFDPMDKQGAAVEKLLPTPEEPMDKDEALKDKIEAPAPKLNLDLQMTEVEKGTEKVVSKADDKKTDVKKDEPKKTEAKKVVEEKPVAKIDTKVEAQPLSAPPAALMPAVAGGYYIQIGSYQDSNGAKTDWPKLQKKYATYLKGLSMKTERVDLGKKGVWYRLYAGAVAEERARKICASLKNENPGGCIVAKK